MCRRYHAPFALRFGESAGPIVMNSTTSAVARCAAALSTNADTSAAVREACEAARESLGGPPDLALAFFSTHHTASADRLAV